MIHLKKTWDAKQILEAAHSIGDYLRKIEGADRHIDVAVDRLQSMCGMTAQAAQDFCARLGKIQEEYQCDLETLRDAMFTLGYKLSSCQSRLDGIPEEALAVGLDYSPEAEIIFEPTHWDEDRDNYDRYVVYRSLDEQAKEIFIDVEVAFRTFESQCGGLFARAEKPEFFGLLSQSLVPDGAVGAGEWFVNRTEDVSAGITWGRIAVGKGVLHVPVRLGADGKSGVLLRPAKTLMQRIFYGHDPRNWVLQKPAPEWLSKSSSFVAKHSEKLKVAGGVTAFASGLVDAYNQWEADELRPDLTQGQRQARAVVTGAMTAVGGWGGTLGGAKLGAAVGVVIGGPVGAAVGGIVGGIIGGVAGSWFGGKFADGFKVIVGGNS